MDTTFMKKGLPNTEHEIQNTILEFLQYQGYMAWRNNTGAQKFQNKSGGERWVRFGQPGFSDIFAIQPKTGRFIAIECKRPETKKNVTTFQRDFIQRVNAQGGIGFVATSVDEVAEGLGMKGLV